MNLFEDLVEELKDENLLEETVIETSDSESAPNSSKSTEVKANQQNYREVSFNAVAPTAPPLPAPSAPEAPVNQSPAAKPVESLDFEMQQEPAESGTEAPAEMNSTEAALVIDNDDPTSFKPEKPKVSENEFYRRRATEEVSSLKIVEHILSGVEREHMKIFPKSYDDVAVSKALHDFLKITGDPQSPEHSQAEFKLMQETESWYSSLSYRDKHVSVGDLRRYCETSKPPLSSQALVALARFYRNSPFSESVRSKFDMVVTRLLSKETGHDKRELVFDKDELVEQLTGLYADWSSIPLYAADDDSEVLIAALKFQDFISEANESDSFEELIRNDFFNRLRIFKESTGESFFSPLLTATAIESNIEIGNRYVDLVAREREKETVAELEEKYKYLVDQTVSDVTSKTLQLVELLTKRKEELEKSSQEKNFVEEKEVIDLEDDIEKSAETAKKSRFGFLKINKWILAFAVLSLLFCGGLYVWVEYLNPPPVSPTASPVKTVNLDNSSLKEFYILAKINNEIFFAITTPAWDKLSKETKEDVLRKTLEIGNEKGYKKVQLIDKEGKSVGFASEEKIDVTPQP